MPFKANADRRHRIPRQRQRVTNWAEYDAGLRARGSLIVWFSAEAIEGWRAEARTGRGGQPMYSDLAIATALTLRAVFRLALRQTEGLIASILRLLGLDLAVPDHSTMSRRAETLEVPRPRCGRAPVHLLVDSTGLRLCGPGEWLAEKHGTRRRRGWKKLHLATDADTGHIVASALTDKDADDGSRVGPLLDRVDGSVASFTGDGAFDRDDVYAEVAARRPGAAVVVPPRSSAVPSDAAGAAPTQRDLHLRCIAERGRLEAAPRPLPPGDRCAMGWQKASGYNFRALVESDISRWKRVIGDGLRSRTDGRQETEVAIATNALNRMLDLGRPEYVRIA
jgi:Transposase DDE domain